MHQPRGMSRTVTLCLQFPIVTTTLWGQLAGKTMTVLPRSLLLYCTVMFVYVYQTPTFSPHCGGNVKVKTQHIYQDIDIPVLLRDWGEAVVTNDWCIIFSLYCTSHENLVLSHPQNYIDTKHKMSQCMVFPTIRHVRPAKPQISLRIRAVWSEPLLVAWVFYDC